MIYFPAHTFKCVCHCTRAMFRVLGMYNFAWHPQILTDQLTLSQPRGADYAHQIIHTGTPGFSDLPTPLLCMPAPIIEDSLFLEVNRKAYK